MAVPVVNELELFDVTERHSGEGKGRCPRRFTGEHEDINPSCTVNFDKDLYYCPVCKAGGKISVKLNSMQTEQTPVLQAVASIEEATEDVKNTPRLDPVHLDWLRRRGITLDSGGVIYFSIRVGEDDDWLVIEPVSGASQRRWMGGGDAPNGMRYAPGLAKDKSKLFWATPLPHAGEIVWVTEGPLDAVATAQCGASAVVSTYGNNLSDQQAYELRDYFTIIAYDRDAGGVTGAEQASKQIAKFGGTCAVVELPPGDSCKDPGDLLQFAQDEFMRFILRTELEYQPDEQRYVEAWREFSSFVPVPTGIEELDTLLRGGWFPGNHVVKGPPKSYKSTVMLNQARAAARRGLGVLYLSTELSRREVWARLSAGIEGAPAWNVLEANPGELPEACYEEQAQLAKYIKTFENIPLKRLLQIGDAYKPALVIVDYLQGLASVSGEDASSLMARVKDASALLTAWARDTKTAVLTVSSAAEGGDSKYSKDVQYDAASVSSIERSGYASEASVRMWEFEMVRRGIPDGVDATVTLNTEELV